MSAVVGSLIASLALAAGGANDIDLVVVAPAAWAEALATFIQFKAARPGIASCSAWPLEEVTGADRAGVDDAERLKRALYEAWKAGKCDAVLLVGDASVLPYRYMCLDRVTKEAANIAFYPSDHYYADVAHPDGSFDSWNCTTDSHHATYFGEVHGEAIKADPINFDAVSYVPEIAIGRWPAHSAEEAGAIAAKSMRCEGAWSGTPELLFVAAGGWINNQARIERLATPHGSRDGEGCPWTPRLLAWFKPDQVANEPAVRTALESATPPRMILHTGHGQPWGWEGCLKRETLAPLADDAALPVLFSIGCSTAEVAPQPPYTPYVDTAGVRHAGTRAGEVFEAPPAAPATIQPVDLDFTSLSEDAVRWPAGGAVAAIGCVTGSQPCGQTLLDGFIEAARSAPESTIGQWWCSALNHYYSAEHLAELKPDSGWYPPSIFFQGMKFVLLGDPTLRPLACGQKRPQAGANSQ